MMQFVNVDNSRDAIENICCNPYLLLNTCARNCLHLLTIGCRNIHSE